MPKREVGRIEMYYEIHGRGRPLVLIMGLRRDHSWFYRQTPEFSEHYQTLVFDNRGSGRTDKPREPYSIKGMADDTTGLMEDLGISSAHVLGVSMGGYIAQELALNYPDKVQGLVLCCTSPGGRRHLPMSEALRNEIINVRGLTSEQIFRKSLPILFSDRYLGEFKEDIEAFVEMSLEYDQPASAFLRQLEACQAHDTCDRLPGLKAPTLVMTGSDDELVPAGNSPILAELIPGAGLEVIPGGGHCFFVEMADRFNEAVLSFLEQVEG